MSEELKKVLVWVNTTVGWEPAEILPVKRRHGLRDVLLFREGSDGNRYNTKRRICHRRVPPDRIREYDAGLVKGGLKMYFGRVL